MVPDFGRDEALAAAARDEDPDGQYDDDVSNRQRGTTLSMFTSRYRANDGQFR